MANFGDLWVRLGLDASKFKAGMAEAKTSLTTWRDDTNANTASMAKWGAAITATVAPVVALGTAVYAMQQKFGAMADQITDLSYTTGMSTEKIQQLQYAAVLSNDSFSTVSMGINYLTLSMQKAGDATSEAGKAFAALGVSTAGKSPDQVFEDTTVALMGMKDETQRNSIAMTLYGRSWKEMLPFMEEYIQNREKIQKTETFSKQELQDLKDAKKAWDDLGNSVTIYSGKLLVDAGNAYARAKNGADIWTAAQQLNIDKMKEALRVANDLAAKEKKSSREDWEIANKDLLDKSGAGVNWDLYNGQVANKRKAAIAAAPNPLEGKTSEQIEIEILTKYTIPDLKTAYDDLAASGADPEAQARAYGDLIAAKEKLIELTTEEADAQKDLKSATDALYDSQNKLNDIDKDYSRNLQMLDPRDVQGFINLKMRYQWDKEDQQKEVADAQLTVDTSKAETEIKNLVEKYDGSEINMTVTATGPTAAQTAEPGEVVDFYTKNGLMAAPTPAPLSEETISNLPSPFLSSSTPAAPATNTKLGNIIINGPLTVNGDKSFERMIQDARIRAGVRS